MSIRAHLAAPSTCDVVSDIRGQRRFAHAGAASHDDQIGWLEATHLGIQVPEAGCQAGELSLALIRARRHVDCGG